MRTAAELDALIEELTVDAYNDEEQESGFVVAAEEALTSGERARIAGTPVELIGVDLGPDSRTGLRAKVRAGNGRHEVSLADLDLPEASALGDVVAAYRRWLGWR